MQSIQIKYKKAFEEIKKADKILLVTHVNPDGDAVSSMCAMAELMKRLGKSYVLYCHNEPPAKFRFLSCAKEFIFKIDNTGVANADLLLDFSSFDLIMVFDCGSLGRTTLDLEIKARKPKQKVVEFDHHPKHDDYADIEIRIPQAASTSEIIYSFFKANRLDFNKEIAQAIMTGISTDTGNFLFPSTSENTINISSEMMQYGANLPRIVSRTMRDKSLSGMKLWGRVMSNLKINRRYNLAVTALTRVEISESDIDDEEIEGISNFISNLKGVKAIIFLREKEQGVVKGSLRTSDPLVDVSKLARLLHGGGHPKASGFTLEGTLVETEHGWKII
jgi:bifunctional oligoribonuclease and PAP phosphatase NrnA